MKKTILITGSTDGIGKQTALELARMGHQVIIHGRSEDRAIKTTREIKKQSGNSDLYYLVADFASLEQVRSLAHNVKQKVDKLDVLINNAGVLEPKFLRSQDGYEMTFAVNHLAHFLLTLSLLDFIKSNSPARIVNVSSGIHSSSINIDNLQAEKTYSGNSAYCLSKLCNVLFTYQLSKRLGNTGVTSNCLHPGVINTKLFRAGWGGGGASLKNGAENSVYVATSPELNGVTGKYFVNKRDVPSADISYDSAIQRKLWTISKDLVSL